MSTVPIRLKNCPVCGRRIRDRDKTGCEDRGGQRCCVEHLPDETAGRESAMRWPK